MSIIKGRFIYSAYYNSVQEMKNDPYLEVGYYVAVVDDKYKKDYKIVDKKDEKGMVYEDLNNGLYALSVILSNDTTVDITKPYETYGPTESSVGLIEAGSQFKSRDTNDVFNLMFYNGWCNAKVVTNLSNRILVRGEANVLNEVKVDILRATEQIVKAEITVGPTVKVIEEEWEMGESYIVDFDEIIRENTRVIVKLTSLFGKEHVISTDIETQYPTYYSIVTHNLQPSSVVIKTMPNTYDNEFVAGGNFVTTDLFLAIPSTKRLLSIKDENGIEMKYNTSSYLVAIMHGLDNVEYRCYNSSAILCDNVYLNVELEDV